MAYSVRRPLKLLTKSYSFSCKTRDFVKVSRDVFCVSRDVFCRSRDVGGKFKELVLFRN